MDSHNDVRGLPMAKEEWEEQYQAGRWAYLANIPEMSRYPFIAAHIERDAERPRVLDVGGGEGVLYQYLDDRRLDNYVCVDIAESAFVNTKVPRDKSKFIACDIEQYEYQPDDQFTAAVFNEMIYFTKSPMTVLEKAAERIQPSGVIIISMFHYLDPNSPMRKTIEALWKKLDNGPWPTVDFVALTNLVKNRTWMVRVLKVGAKVIAALHLGIENFLADTALTQVAAGEMAQAFVAAI